MRLQIYFFIFLILTSSVLATSHYSFEHAEELKPLIDWRDYGQKAFDESIQENKPVFLLLTAPSWCYWCQVYESEEYLFNPQVIDTINKDFIPIYVDADQRQDLTRQYLEGGWPSTTILAPSRERLFGFSGVRPVPNMIANLQRATEFVNTQGFSNQIFYNYKETPEVIPTETQLRRITNFYISNTLQIYDSVNGGFGSGQKFPQGRALDFSLELYESTGNKQFLNLVQNTLQNQYTKIEEIETNYNLFDPVEGGFHRYGTRPDWTPPHYEKMLYDNARLLKAYFHLSQLAPEDKLAKEVFERTDSYIKEKWYDKEEGGFYGNTDVHGEEEYYGQNPRPDEPPRVETAKYTDWNTEAILTYLYLWQETGNEEYKEISENSLDFFSNEMISKNGAFHYSKDGKKSVTGNILDNSYLLLALIEGYEVLDDEKYLEASKVIADYSLDNLYDWNSGGFFERNSKDTELYTSGDNILLTKPAQENGIMAYAFLKLYKQTNDPIYLNAGIKTIGANLNQIGSLDRGYYFIKSSQFILQNNLLNEFSQINVTNIEKEKQETFWLNNLILKEDSAKEFEVSEEGLEKIKGPIIILILVSLIAGFISFVSPCTLPILPAYVAYTFSSSKNNIKGMTIAFFLGLSLLFTLLGMSATVIGGFLRSHLTIFSQVAGILILLFGIYMLFGKGFSGFKIKQSRPNSYLGSFFLGAVFGISWTPCVGPILVSILLLASTTTSVFIGGLMLFVYAIGLALPLVIISTYLGKINKEGRLWRIISGKELIFKISNKEFTIHSNSLISGLLFILLGYLIFSGTLITFNQYITTTPIQQFMFTIEERLLGFIR